MKAEDATGYLQIRNFEQFQHYKDRRPPWIKLYRDLWSDPEFYVLSETERYFLISLFVIASQTNNRIPYQQSWLKHEMATKKHVPIERLIETHWLEIIPATTVVVASNPASISTGPPASKNANVSASTVLALARSREKRREEQSREEQRKEEKEQIKPSVRSHTSNIEEEDRTNERTDGKDITFKSIEDMQKFWAPVEGYLRKQVVEETFLAFYAGCRLVDLNHKFVVVAVPQTLLARNGNLEATEKSFSHMIENAGTGLLRGRALKLVSLDLVEDHSQVEET